MSSIDEIAEAEKIGRSFVRRLLDLTLLAPDIQEAILEGRQPMGTTLAASARPVLLKPAEHRKMSYLFKLWTGCAIETGADPLG